jgi:hypothetical protein
MSRDRFAPQLAQLASTIELRPADGASIAGRATRRRQVRRSLAAVSVVVAVGASTVLVTRGGDRGGPDQAVGSAAVAPSPFDWAVTEPSHGISGITADSSRPVVLDDGTVYSLSTAPNPQAMETPPGPHMALYSSADGVEWTPANLPENFWASSLAGAGSRLYAVGTSPAGGGAVTYELATSDDGGAAWTTTEVPSELRELQERYPDEILTGQPSIAVRDGTVVITLRVNATLDLERRLPAGVTYDEGQGPGWGTTAEGVVVGGAAECAAAAGVPAGVSPPSTAPCGDESTSTARTYTWDELGVDDELRELVMSGRRLAFVSRGGGAFEPVDLGERGTGDGQLVATDDGFVLALGRYDESGVEVLRSTDGSTWEPAGELPGYGAASGVVAGRAAIATTSPDDDAAASLMVHLAQPDGTWLTVDPRQALDEPEATSTYDVAFGPLGWAAAISDGNGTIGSGRQHVVHSVDGTTLSLAPVGTVDQGSMLDVAVTADAVLVRITTPIDSDPTTPPRQEVVVGTPRG